MSEPYIGQILLFAGSYAPAGYLACDGSTLQISQYDTLFNLIGTTYGGDGQTTFALPDLRGRVGIGMGTGIGLPTYTLGQSLGTESVTLSTPQLPSHTHPAQTTGAAGSSAAPGPSSSFADEAGGSIVNVYAPYNSAGQTALAANSIGPAGQSQSHENRQPFLAITVCIAVYGTYPSQS